jgi:hypothetical protein
VLEPEKLAPQSPHAHEGISGEFSERANAEATFICMTRQFQENNFSIGVAEPLL